MKHIPHIGTVWPQGNFVWGRFVGEGETSDAFSPLDGSLVQSASLLSAGELEGLFNAPPLSPIPVASLEEFALRLLAELEALRLLLRDAMQRETGFNQRDCDEMLEGSFAFISHFCGEFSQSQSAALAPTFYEANGQKRRITLARVAWGTVAVILPQNAFLLVALTVAFNALATGNRAILRAPLQSSRSALLLAQAFFKAQVPGDGISVVLTKSREFVSALCAAPSPVFLHYMGSSTHAPAILRQCFEAGKMAIADGAGNVWVYLDESVESKHAAQLLCEGATRYNGQTCTSINGAIIHPAIYNDVKAQLRTLLENTRSGPLFDEAQTQWCVEQIHNSGGEILIGGGRDGNYLRPSLVDSPPSTCSLVREGIFGPAMWIARGDAVEFIRLWPQNSYPLCAGILQVNPEIAKWLSHLPNAARVVFNGDPSIEHIFEPWGAYPASGANIVSAWHEKYTRVVSVDETV
jgi:acyl-CoA reductase-like NAD-dependent aldehyde dehydrogenase